MFRFLFVRAMTVLVCCSCAACGGQPSAGDKPLLATIGPEDEPVFSAHRNAEFVRATEVS